MQTQEQRDRSILARLRARAAELPPVPAEEVARRETPEERAERLAAKRAAWQARHTATVPPLYADATFGDLSEDQRFTWPAESLNLILAGSKGTGKTHAAYALANDRSRAGDWVVAVRVVDLLEAYRPSTEDRRLTADAEACTLLVLDDLGATKVSDYAVEKLTALLDTRISHGRRTAVTTNLPAAQLEEQWGERMMDRLRFRQTVKKFTGPSRRATW